MPEDKDSVTFKDDSEDIPMLLFLALYHVSDTNKEVIHNVSLITMYFRSFRTLLLFCKV